MKLVIIAGNSLVVFRLGCNGSRENGQQDESQVGLVRRRLWVVVKRRPKADFHGMMSECSIYVSVHHSQHCTVVQNLYAVQ